MELKNSKTRIVTHFLVEDIEEASLISVSLKRLDVEVIRHSNLQSLWKGLTETPSSMVLVDIRLMNASDKLFLDHPYVRNGQTEVVIFHREDDYPLLKMVNPTKVFDFLPESVSYETFVFHTVNKLKKILAAEKRALDSLAEVKHLEARLKLSQKETLRVHQSFSQQVDYKTFCQTFWKNKQNNDNFVDCFVRTGVDSGLLDAIIIFFSSDEGSTIRSVRHEHDIVQEIAPVKLEKIRKNLMSESFVKKTCSLIARDKLGLKAHAIHIKDHVGNTSYTFCFRLKDAQNNKRTELVKSLDNFLNSEFKGFVASNMEEFFVNEFSFYGRKSLEIYLKLNISALFDYIQQKPSRFMFKEFNRDFFSRLYNLGGKDNLMTSLGCGEYLIGINEPGDISLFKEFFNNFSYWSYFDDCENNFSRMIDVDLQQLTRAELGKVILGKQKVKSTSIFSVSDEGLISQA